MFECQKIFIIAEQIFLVYTSTHDLNIIENEKITKSRLDNIKVISHLNSFVDCNSSNKLNEEVKLNVLEQTLKLYRRVHSFSHAKDFTNKQNQYSSNQNKVAQRIKENNLKTSYWGVDILNILLSKVYTYKQNKMTYIWDCCYICLLISSKFEQNFYSPLNYSGK